MKNVTFSLLMLFAVAGCSTSQPIYNANTTVPVTISNDAMEKAIVEALLFKRWKILSQSEGKIVAGIEVRTHYAEVEITFDANKYEINYKDSNNLDHSSARNKIHRNYNKWIKLLATEIDRNAYMAKSQ
ncbi:hypothetical protein [Thalassotalea marina]|uniref:Lipoprotein n=1 Tax=Thalassotalea marina TaxID=1673741 RepID=A0A919EKZ2_9GAMM|nr:hypothetical protein [Thalassotalea marina]GHF97064.1 hypothetical protein GCM10017161_26470 [Thalassotalea marina]